jgi:hypothetical protein
LLDAALDVLVADAPNTVDTAVLAAPLPLEVKYVVVVPLGTVVEALAAVVVTPAVVELDVVEGTVAELT